MTTAHAESQDNSAPAVDVVILSWGRVDDTCAAIDSALAQQQVALRVIVVDQGTEAEELARLQAFCGERPNVTLICNGHNRGVPGGRNQGSAAGAAPYIVALDNDAEFASPYELCKAIERFESDAELGILAFRIRLFSEEADDRSSWSYLKPVATFAGTRFLADRFVGAGHMIRRAPFEAIGGYDDRLVFLHEETELSYKMINQGFKIIYDPHVVIRHKVSPERRVSWSGDRYYYNIRNKIYLTAKFNLNLVSSALDLSMEVLDGFKCGYARGVIRGLGGGIALLPTALKLRWSDPAVRLSPEAKQYMRAALGVAGMSFQHRAMRRLRFAMRRAAQK
jgi:GT2 family glycosyltransferase